jgi:ADP-ribose pyrophosphatase YjhB (NUDIX family)
LKESIRCPRCGEIIEKYKNPFPTVDIIIIYEEEGVERGVVLIYRKNPPRAWALPGGFVDYGESLEDAAVREAREETGIEIKDLIQFHTYSDPERDPRHHSISTVFIARGNGPYRAKDDAESIGIFPFNEIPEEMAFDHRRILSEYLEKRRGQSP